MAKVIDTVKQNLPVIKELFQIGKISGTVLNEVKIYDSYNNAKGGKMERYNKVAEDMRVSEKTVIRVVKDMERDV